MKRKDLIKRLTDAGCVFVRPGARGHRTIEED
jgi:hypothetical protein